MGNKLHLLGSELDLFFKAVITYRNDCKNDLTFFADSTLTDFETQLEHATDELIIHPTIYQLELYMRALSHYKENYMENQEC